MSDHKQSIYGVHAIEAMLTTHPDQVIEVLFLASEKPSKRIVALKALVVQAQRPMRTVKMAHFCAHLPHGEVVHQGVVAQVTPMAPPSLKTLLAHAQGPITLVALDCVQDPQNLGACMRTCCAMGVAGLILPKDKSATVNETARKVACGADAWLPIYRVSNLSQTLKSLQKAGFWCLGTSEHATQTIGAVDLSGHPTVIVVGNEGRGLRRLTVACCDHLVRLPTRGPLQSLNVSVALGMVLFHHMSSLP